MDEQQIAVELAQNVPQQPPLAGGYPEPEPEAPQDFVDKMLPEQYQTQSQLLDYLNVPLQQRHDPRISDYTRAVYEWARESAGTNDINHLLRVISEQEQHMGIRHEGDRLRRLGEYVKIAKLRASLAARERSLYA